MSKRSGLGKGLDALIPSGQTKPSPFGDGSGVTQVAVDLISAIRASRARNSILRNWKIWPHPSASTE